MHPKVAELALPFCRFKESRDFYFFLFPHHRCRTSNFTARFPVPMVIPASPARITQLVAGHGARAVRGRGDARQDHNQRSSADGAAGREPGVCVLRQGAGGGEEVAVLRAVRPEEPADHVLL